MSHVCAKPACTETVHVWLDFAPSSHQVIEKATRSEVSVGLCESHAGRFTVPDGWSLELLPRSPAQPAADGDEIAPDSSIDSASDVTEDNAEQAEPISAPANRTHTRERPWFLASTDVVVDEREGDPADVVTSRADHDEAVGAPTAGSLLHRAFHGPDKASDTSRADAEQVDELEPRRAARTPPEVHNNGMAELPFPPFAPEHRVAVS